MSISEKIISLRKSRGMSQEDLAEKLNVSRQAISRWELGSAMPDASNILMLSEIFNVSTDYLLKDEYETPAAPQNIPIKKKANRIIGIIISSIGLLCNLVVYILSRIVEVMIPIINYTESGTKQYTWSSDFKGHSFKFFIREYDLELLITLFCLLVFAGIIINLIDNVKIKSIFKKLKK